MPSLLPLLFALASTAFAAGTPDLPRLPPREGELKACPTQEVLATRFSTQSDGNGGGFGYYAVKWDDQRRPHVANPSEQWIQDYLHDEAAGSIPDADTKLATLWGYRCAYPELDYVKAALDEARAAYLKDTGISAETEIAWHTLLADNRKSGREEGDSCPKGDAWHTEDPSHLARQYQLCGGMSAEKAVAHLLETMDAQPDPVVSAGVVGFCSQIIAHDGVGNLTDGAYWTWKLCDRVAGTYTAEDLDAGLRKAGVSDWVRLAYTVKAEKGRAEVEKDRPRFAKLEGGWPGLTAMWDGSVTQVNEKYLPILTKWRETVDTVDPWLDTLRDGPAYAEGCREKWLTPLRAYVADNKVVPRGRALVQVIQEPVAVGLLEALAVCEYQTNDVAFGDMAGRDLLSGTQRVTRWHQALLDALASASSGGDGKYQGKAIPPGLASGTVNVRFEPDAARGWLRGIADKAEERPFSYEETVAGLKKEGDFVTISFPHRSGTESVPVDCSPDYSHVARIDEYGKFWYDWKCKGTKTMITNDTYRSVKVPAWEAEKLAVGGKVAVQLAGQGAGYMASSYPTPAEGSVVWVKKGEDVIWVAGISAP